MVMAMFYRFFGRQDIIVVQFPSAFPCLNSNRRQTERYNCRKPKIVRRCRPNMIWFNTSDRTEYSRWKWSKHTPAQRNHLLPLAMFILPTSNIDPREYYNTTTPSRSESHINTNRPSTTELHTSHELYMRTCPDQQHHPLSNLKDYIAWTSDQITRINQRKQTTCSPTPATQDTDSFMKALPASESSDDTKRPRHGGESIWTGQKSLGRCRVGYMEHDESSSNFIQWNRTKLCQSGYLGWDNPTSQPAHSYHPR
jgi:hypothetical protein